MRFSCKMTTIACTTFEGLYGETSFCTKNDGRGVACPSGQSENARRDLARIIYIYRAAFLKVGEYSVGRLCRRITDYR